MDALREVRRVLPRTKTIVAASMFGTFIILTHFASDEVWTVGWSLVAVIMLVELGWRAATRDLSWKALLFSMALAIVIIAGVWGAITTRSLPAGEIYVYLVALMAAVTDAGAQVIGLRYGRRGTFFPSVSPNKSIRGFYGGIFCGWAAGAIFLALLWPVIQPHPPTTIAFMVMALPFMAVAGDLLASKVKRSMGIKDFSALLGNGTGGLSDRLDSWVACFAVAGLFLAIL